MHGMMTEYHDDYSMKRSLRDSILGSQSLMSQMGADCAAFIFALRESHIVSYIIFRACKTANKVLWLHRKSGRSSN